MSERIPPKLQIGVLGNIPSVPAGEAMPARMRPAAALIVVLSAPAPQMVLLGAAGEGELEVPGGVIGFAHDAAAGELVIVNATDADITDIQVLGIRPAGTAHARQVSAIELLDAPATPSTVKH